MVFKPVSLRLLLGILLLSLKILAIANPLGQDVEGSGNLRFVSLAVESSAA